MSLIERAAQFPRHVTFSSVGTLCDVCGEYPCVGLLVEGGREVDEAWHWLRSTRRLQSETYGYDLDALASEPAALAPYVTWNLLAAYQELGEVGVEFSWKPWAVDKPFVNRQRVLDEIVDVGHFMGNILVAMGVTDEEYERCYKLKQDKNRRRQASGTYSAQKGTLGEGSEVE